MLSHIKDDTFHLDHMLPQTPKADDNNFKYYCTTSSTGEELLVLKEGHDFPEGVISGMKYDEFKEKTLHRIGNIRLFYPELNEGKGNGITKLPDHKNFVKYEDISILITWMGAKINRTISLIYEYIFGEGVAYNELMLIDITLENIQTILSYNKPTIEQLSTLVSRDYKTKQKYDYLLSDELLNLEYGSTYLDIENAWNLLISLDK